MYIYSDEARGKCDYCYDNVASIGMLAQGATGRICEVMWICDACAKKSGTPIHKAQDVRRNIKKYFGSGAFVDF